MVETLTRKELSYQAEKVLHYIRKAKTDQSNPTLGEHALQLPNYLDQLIFDHIKLAYSVGQESVNEANLIGHFHNFAPEKVRASLQRLSTFKLVIPSTDYELKDYSLNILEITRLHGKLVSKNLIAENHR